MPKQRIRPADLKLGDYISEEWVPNIFKVMSVALTFDMKEGARVCTACSLVLVPEAGGDPFSHDLDPSVVLLRHIRHRKVGIPDITDDDVAVLVIDELKHRLKARPLREGSSLTPIADALNTKLNTIIEDFALKTDPHSYATMGAARGK